MAQWTDAFSSGWATLILNVSESGTSAATNAGTISWSLQIRKDKACQSFNNGGASIYVNIGGTRRYTGTAFDIRTLSVGSTKTLASGSFSQGHVSDGTLSLAVSAGLTSGVGLGNAALSSTFTGTTIPRASYISSVTSSVSVDGKNAVAISIGRYSSSFTHTVKIVFGSHSKSITGVGTSTSFVIPKEWLDAIPSATSGKATVTVTTYSGSTQIGSAVSTTFTLTVPAYVVPTIDDVTIAEAVAKVTTAFGARYVQSLSQVNVDIEASGALGSTIKKYSTTLDGVTYVQSAFTSNVINGSGELTVKVVVTDSRGRTATVEEKITVVAYTPPAVSISYLRCDSDGTQNSSGTCTKITISGKVASVDSQNTKALKLKYKSATDEVYTERIVTISSLGWEFTTEVIINNTDPTVTYEFIAELTDKISTTPAEVKTGVVVMSFLAGGTGAEFRKPVYIDEDLLVACPREDGSVVYLSLEATGEEIDEICDLLGIGEV